MLSLFSDLKRNGNKRLYNNYIIYWFESFPNIENFTIIFLHKKINTIWINLAALMLKKKNLDIWLSMLFLKWPKILLDNCCVAYKNTTIFYTESQLIKVNAMIIHASHDIWEAMLLMFLEFL